MIKSLRTDATACSGGVIKDESEEVLGSTQTSSNLYNVYLAGRFRLDSLTLFSFSGALHSVLTSPFADMEYSGVRLRTACWAECIPSAGFRPFRKSNSTQYLGISTHIPVLSRSNGGVSSCTESRMTLFLPSHK